MAPSAERVTLGSARRWREVSAASGAGASGAVPAHSLQAEDVHLRDVAGHQLLKSALPLPKFIFFINVMTSV